MTAERHDRVARLLREHGPLAPPELRSRLEAEIARANERRRIRGPAWTRVALAGAAVAASLLAFVLAAPAILGGDPNTTDVHGLSADGPTADAPPNQPGSGGLLAANVEGVTFPDWEREFGWKPIGRRSDELDGRRTETVFYEHEGHTIGYTIVSGSTLDPPDDAKPHRVNGVDVRVYDDDHGHTIATFERQGHTCVLSGHVEHRPTLVNLASWRGDGRVVF
jgi:hypothetical protein